MRPAIIPDMENGKIDWKRVDTVLLDMDGTVLDLNFDNRFWQEHLPQRYADTHGVDRDAAEARLRPIFEHNRGQLEWYCVDFWSRELALDVAALKHELADLICPLPGAIDFLDAVTTSGRELWLATNAHRASLDLKMQRTGLRARFTHIVSSHDLGYPKEHPEFWRRLTAKLPFDPQRALFVDDNLTVLETAHAFGIGQTVAILKPDTARPARESEYRPSAQGLTELLPF